MSIRFEKVVCDQLCHKFKINYAKEARYDVLYVRFGFDIPIFLFSGQVLGIDGHVGHSARAR